MTNITIEGKEIPIFFNNYVLFQFSRALGEDSPNAAMVRLQNMNDTKGNISTDGIEAFCHLLFEMSKMGAKKSGKELAVTYEDCFEVINDHKTIEVVVNELMSGLPAPETIDKKKAAQKARISKITQPG